MGEQCFFLFYDDAVRTVYLNRQTTDYAAFKLSNYTITALL